VGRVEPAGGQDAYVRRAGPGVAGELHCQLMAAANEVVDYRRLRHLAEITTRWLERLPAAALFTGICHVHRSSCYR
jgi:hypothetical protein